MSEMIQEEKKAWQGEFWTKHVKIHFYKLKHEVKSSQFAVNVCSELVLRSLMFLLCFRFYWKVHFVVLGKRF